MYRERQRDSHIEIDHLESPKKQLNLVASAYGQSLITGWLLSTAWNSLPACTFLVLHRLQLKRGLFSYLLKYFSQILLTLI